MSSLIANDFTQVEETGYFETYSPVSKLTTLRFLPSTIATKNLFMHQLDVNNAILNDNLVEEVHMHLSPGFTSTLNNHVYRLYKRIYGLRLSNRK